MSTRYHEPVSTNPRHIRNDAECRQLERGLGFHVRSRPGMADLGPDPLVTQLASASGFTALDIRAHRLILGTRYLTAVLVPSRIWHNEGNRRLLAALKLEAEHYQVTCILVPQRSIRAPRRLASATAISHCRGLSVSTTDRMTVLMHLMERGFSSVVDCANLIGRHDDPFGAVLALDAQGWIAIDRSRPLGPHSRVDQI
jgi:hypothetical protein